MNEHQARIDAYFDGELSPIEVAQFENWLAESETHRRLFAGQALDHLLLREALLDFASPTADGAPRVGQAQGLRQRLWRAFTRPTPLSITVAALVIGLLVTAMAFMLPPAFRPVQHSTATDENGEPKFVASLASTFEAEWAERQIGTQRGSQLGPGHSMQLVSGYAEVAFHSGANIVIEGPATLTIANSNELSLASGRLVACVPSAAKGFTVATTQGRIVDLGTEFAVDANSRDEVEVHVIEGKIELRAASDEPLDSSRVLTAGNAAKFRRVQDKTIVAPIAYQVEGYTRRAPAADVEWTAETPLPVGRALSLWLSADYGVVYDAQGHVAIWKDRLTGDNRHAENALQTEAARRPTLTADGIGGQPALVLDGRATSLLTSLRAASGEQAIFLVAAPHRFAGRSGFQLLNTGSAPNFVIDMGSRGEVVARSFDGKRDLPNLRCGAIGAGTPMLIAFTHSQSANKAQLRVNGQTQIVNSASPATFGKGKLYLGSYFSEGRFFDGRLAEVIIYDDALAEEETAAVIEYLSTKYALSR